MSNKHTPTNTSINRTALRERDAAPYMGYSRAWLRQGRMHGRGPAYVRAGRSVRYYTDDLDRWIDEHRVDPARHDTE